MFSCSLRPPPNSKNYNGNIKFKSLLRFCGTLADKCFDRSHRIKNNSLVCGMLTENNYILTIVCQLLPPENASSIPKNLKCANSRVERAEKWPWINSTRPILDWRKSVHLLISYSLFTAQLLSCQWWVMPTPKATLTIFFGEMKICPTRKKTDIPLFFLFFPPTWQKLRRVFLNVGRFSV